MDWLAVAYFAIVVAVVLVGIVFERGRYKPKVSGDKDWEMTGEKFQDPTSGKWMRVRHNRATGERDYVEIEQPK